MQNRVIFIAISFVWSKTVFSSKYCVWFFKNTFLNLRCACFLNRWFFADIVLYIMLRKLFCAFNTYNTCLPTRICLFISIDLIFVFLVYLILFSLIASDFFLHFSNNKLDTKRELLIDTRMAFYANKLSLPHRPPHATTNHTHIPL